VTPVRRRSRVVEVRRASRFRHLDEGVAPEAGVPLRVALLDDVAAPGGHRAEQQALADVVRPRGRQLGDAADGLRPQDTNALAVALEAHLALRNTSPRRPPTGELENYRRTSFSSTTRVKLFLPSTHQQENGGQDLINGVDLLYGEADDLQGAHHRPVARAVVVGGLKKEKGDLGPSSSSSSSSVKGI